MANRIAASPKVRNNGTVTVVARIPPMLREHLISISVRREEYLNTVIEKALSQYVKSDQRRHS